MNMQNVILKPIITEKAMKDASFNKYTFAVDKNANKSLIKKAIENIFGVTVEEVSTRIVKGKTKLVGPKRTKVKGASFKKAIVRVKKDQKIDMFGKAEAEAKK